MFYLRRLNDFRQLSYAALNCCNNHLKAFPLSTVANQSSVPSKCASISADTFGDYADTSQLELCKDDPEDIKEKERKKIAFRRSPSVYIDMVKSHLENHQYAKAVEVLEERMLKIDRVRPDSYIYDLLISYCGRKGDVSEAFRLYNQIKNRGYHVTGGQYTSLFNACANSSKSRKSLEIANKVRFYLANDKLHRPNIKNYNAMLKAFGRHGDLKTTFKIIDEVLEKRGKVRNDTYNFLLQACISDSNSGFRQCLLVWHRLLQNRTDPSLFTFNLILRATRDCSFGDVDQIVDLLESIVKEGNTRSLRKLTISKVSALLPAHKKIMINPVHENLKSSEEEDCKNQQEENGNGSHELLQHSKSVQTLSKDNVDAGILSDANSIMSFTSLRNEKSFDLPNFLAIKPHLGTVASLTSFKTAYHRLLLFGGATGFLEVMESVNIKPDIKTFTLLLEIIPSTKEAEMDLMSIMQNKGIKFDTGFFNVLIKKRCLRLAYSEGKEVLQLMRLERVEVDIITLGVLALTCQDLKSAEEFVNSVHNAGFRLNSAMVGPLVRRATYIGDLQFALFILRAIKEDNVYPSPKLMALLKKCVELHQSLLKKEI